MKKRYLFLLAAFFFDLSGFSQYKISGYINTHDKNKVVYLSLLKYNEEVAIYPEQILTYTKTDSTGYFEITGQLLPKENMLYRIHSNRSKDAIGLEFIEEGTEKNYSNFIFSNIDTIYFPPDSIWFGNPICTNKADNEWHSSLRYEQKLVKEYSKTQNSDAINRAEISFLKGFKQFCKDSLSEPLVKLLAYSHFIRNSLQVDDYRSNPEFYDNLLEELKVYYSCTSYYNQFLEEVSKLSIAEQKQKVRFYKALCYILIVLVLILLVFILFLCKKLYFKAKRTAIEQLQTLTTQEEKVLQLIYTGKSNKEIAEMLFVSLNTIKTHIGSINAKLNVSNRKELIEKLQNHTGSSTNFTPPVI